MKQYPKTNEQKYFEQWIKHITNLLAGLEEDERGAVWELITDYTTKAYQKKQEAKKKGY